VRIVLVGPAHPYKGGIAQHTTALAHHLAAAGHDVQVWSWKRQYPARLYPGEQRVPGEVPELAVFQPTTEPLSWHSPLGWLRAGRAGRRADAVLLSWTTPVQAPPYLGLLAGLAGRTPVVALCHNVLPHEPNRVDRPLATAVLRRCAGVLVHSAAQQELARALAPRTPSAVATLPPPGLGGPSGVPHDRTGRLLFFGLVRPYKGLPVLLRALARTDWSLTVAGEFWGAELASTQALVEQLGLGGRVQLRPGYVAAGDVAALFATTDALVLPYLSATASIVADLGHAQGLPVVVSDVGTLASSVRDGVDGLVVTAGDEDDLVAALQRLSMSYEELQAGVRPPDADALWTSYVKVIGGLLP
jgi:glycosyltransferase involved in cell wall biosynthesis